MPKIEHNSDGFKYEVTWQREGEQEVNSHIITDWEEDSYEVPVDDVYVPYIVTVKAVNSIGEAIVPPTKVSGFSGEACEYTVCTVLILLHQSSVQLADVRFGKISSEHVNC